MEFLSTCVNLKIPKDILLGIVDEAKDYALMHGISMHSPVCFDRNSVKISRFTLLPTSFPKTEFDKAVNIQVVLNKLMHKIAYDHDFLVESLKSTVDADPFTAQIFKVYESVYNEGFSQPISLGLFRSDYLLNGDMKIKQVEFNTISCSFAGLAPEVSQLHKLVLAKLGYFDKLLNIPHNNSTEGFAVGLIEAWKIYNNNKAVILFVVEDITYNICDQRAIVFKIFEINPRIKIIRRTFNELIKQAELSPNKELIVGNYLVSVVYYRTGYEDSAYPTAETWSIRHLMERSKAIKCPSVQYHLAGCKKIQQVLAQPGVLEKFLDETETVIIQNVFTGLYPLDFDDSGEKAVSMAISHPEKYVMKPQREGGGNNIYGKDIKIALKAMKNLSDRTGFILMDLIEAPLQENYFLGPDNKEIQIENLISELGIYGIIIGDQNEIKLNNQMGHVVRSKPNEENEGGIIAGSGGLDSPYLLT